MGDILGADQPDRPENHEKRGEQSRPQIPRPLNFLSFLFGYKSTRLSLFFLIHKTEPGAGIVEVPFTEDFGLQIGRYTEGPGLCLFCAEVVIFSLDGSDFEFLEGMGAVFYAEGKVFAVDVPVSGLLFFNKFEEGGGLFLIVCVTTLLDKGPACCRKDKDRRNKEVDGSQDAPSLRRGHGLPHTIRKQDDLGLSYRISTAFKR